MQTIKHFLFYILIFFIVSCHNNNPYDCIIDNSIIRYNDSILGDLQIHKRNHAFLSEFNEPPINEFNSQTFRLIITYSWERYAFFYRIEKNNIGGLLTIKKYYREEYKREKNIRDTSYTIGLTNDQFEETLKIINSNCFWTMPVKIKSGGLDGYTCTLEAYDPDSNNPISRKYHAVKRWVPEDQTGFENICKYFINLETNIR